MADNGSAQSQDTKMWPLPSFHFKVTLGSVGEISFSEVSGLETEFEEITYRAGDSNDFTKLKMPGLKKVSDITLKKGIFVSDSQLWKWIGNVNMNIIQRENVTISLLDESHSAVNRAVRIIQHSAVKTWSLTNAWPKKITVEGFKADGNSVAMETLILAHEGIQISE